MEFVKPTQIRIQFKKTLNLNRAKYENRLQIKFKNNENKLNEYTKNLNTNMSNFNFYHFLQDIRYREAINHYRVEINNKKENINDITKILLMFFPYLIKSNRIELTDTHKKLSYFSYEAFYLEDKSKCELEKLIKGFFKNYAELEKQKFLFHRREMTNYLECFLNLYAKTENDIIREEEKKDLFLFHYFRPYIRPEEYFTVSVLEQMEKEKC